MADHQHEKLDLITGAAASIEHSRWANRIIYLFAITAALVVLLGIAIGADKPAHVTTTLAWLIVFFAFLTVVTPSGEQVIKMLAQVQAIRAGTKAGAA